MLLVPLHDLELAGQDALDQAHLWGRRDEMLLAALRLTEQACQEDQLDHRIALPDGLARTEFAHEPCPGMCA